MLTGGRSRRLIWPLVAAGAILLSVVTASSPGNAATWQPTTAAERSALARLHAIADQSTKGPAHVRAADGWPSGVEAVRVTVTTRDAALSAIGTPGAAPGRQRVLLFELRGRFVVYPFSHPAGYNAPATGTYLHILLDAATGDPLDFGVDNRPALMGADARTIIDRG